MGRKKPQVKRRKAKAAKRPKVSKAAPARTRMPPPPEPYVPNWGEVDPAIYESLLDWVDVAEID